MSEPKISYCAIHNVYPAPFEPCWQCANEYIDRAYEDGILFAANLCDEVEKQAGSANGVNLSLVAKECAVKIRKYISERKLSNDGREQKETKE